MHASASSNCATATPGLSSLYERYGFNEIGRRRDYYPAVGGREDAVVMACTLVD
jgi:[ribosomal protein S18]-alanine N-acetyltransferase